MKTVTLGEVIKPAKVVRCGDGVYQVMSMTMHDGIVLQSDRFNKSLASNDKSNYKVVYKNQLVVGFPIDEGVLYVQRCLPAGIMSPAYNVWDIDDSVINNEYLELILHSPKAMQYYSDHLRGSTARRRSIPTPALLAFEFNLPSLDEQQEYVDLIKKQNELIEIKKQQLNSLDDLVKSRFIEMFGNPMQNPMNWDEKTLSDCLHGIDNGRSFVCDNVPRTGNYPAVLKLSAATYGFYQPQENKAMLDKNDFVDKAEVHKGDLLFTRKNTPELVGMSAYVFETPENLMMPDLIFRLNTKDIVNKIYLWQLINHELFRSKIQELASGSAKSMSNISKERLLNMTIPVPPNKLQQQFAKFIEQVESAKQVIKQQLEELETLKKSLIQKYFG